MLTMCDAGIEPLVNTRPSHDKTVDEKCGIILYGFDWESAHGNEQQYRVTLNMTRAKNSNQGGGKRRGAGMAMAPFRQA